MQAAYDAANQMTVIASGAKQSPVTHDANGNMTSDGTHTYTWDARNRLVGVRTVMASGSPSVMASGSEAIAASFAYDALGRRISKTVNGGTTQYLYDGHDIIAELGGNAVSATYLCSLNIDEPFVRQSSGGTEFYHTDALGKVCH